MAFQPLTAIEKPRYPGSRVRQERLACLLWSSPHSGSLVPDQPGLPKVRWTNMAWRQALQRLSRHHKAPSLWVLEPDPVDGPTPQAWAQALASLPTPPLTLVLLPEVLRGQIAPWLDAGADRCLPASTEPSVTQAMLRALLRRCKGMVTSMSMFGPLRFDHDAQTLFSGDQRIWLTCRETQVVAPIFRNGTQRTRTEELLQTLDAHGVQAHNKALVALYVHRVNRKIRPKGVQIDAVRGYGYGLRLLRADLPKTAAPKVSGLQGLSHWLRGTPP